MKKSTMQTLVAFLAAQNFLPSDVADAADEIKAKLNRNAEKAAANREMYEFAKSVIFEGFRVAGTPITITELYDEIKDELPDGFSKSKVQYAVTRLWSDEITKIEGKTNTYTVKAE